MITRVVVIDEDRGGRVYDSGHPVLVLSTVQDDGNTMKLFVSREGADEVEAVDSALDF